MTVGAYWRSVLRQAGADTWAGIGANVQTVGVVLVTAGVLAARLKTVGLQTAKDEALETFLYTVLPSVGSLLVSFVWHLVALPARLHTSLATERDSARRELDNIRDASPRLCLIGHRVVQKTITDNYRQLLGTPYIVQAEFVNDPASSAETAAATEVHADISFLHPDGMPIFEHLPGRWEHTPRPTSDFDPPQAARIGIGERRTLDLAVKHPGGRIFAFTNWSYRARDWQYEPLGLGATEQAWLIRVRLRGPRVDETFTLLLIDNDQPDRPPMIYSQGTESLLRDHPALRGRALS